ncbi:lipid II flippase MurJ [Arcanobacterium wilhelmae]|uniref:murein biosynthesis integral membrane protein MurJ n=1 Tax=Arcanobacterium wilhelmae TaxID=1803177 RepID=UPI002415112D|nr:lipid II flippase MurJ [Arcanobacterium wilhelmae]WFN91071.1 lipid II flippase MurJ [Arcanobacterium wilhelmae]
MKKLLASVVGAAGVIAVLTLASRLMGLVRKLAQSWALSDGLVATAYDTSNTIPNVLFEVAAGGALAGAVIPLISGFLAKKQRADAEQTVSALLTWVVAVGVPLAVTVVALAGPISGAVLGAGASAQAHEVATSLLRVFAFQIPLYGISVVTTGVLQAHGRFVLPALSPLISSIVVTVAFVVYGAGSTPHAMPSAGELAVLAWGTTFGVVAFSLPQLVPVMRLVTVRPTFAFPVGVGRRTLRLAGAGLAALGAQQVAIIAIMVTTNALGGVGAYAAYNYAYSLYMVPYAVLAVPIATAVFPRISAAVGCGDREGSQLLVARSTRLVIAAGMLAGSVLIAVARPAALVISVGRSIPGIEQAMVAMGVSLVGFSLLYHGARVLYALDAGGRVVRANSLAWVCVVLVLAVGWLAGVEGRIATLVLVGVAMSVGMCLGAVAQLVAIRSVAGERAIAGVVRLVALLLPVLVVMTVAAWFASVMLMGVVPGLGGAVVAAVVAGAIVVAGGGAALLVVDRKAIVALKGKSA